MSYAMETVLRNKMIEVFSDLECAAYEMGEEMTWEGLADYAADAMHWSEQAAEWTAMDYDVRQALTEKVAKELI